MTNWKSIEQEAKDVLSGKNTAKFNVAKALRLIKENEQYQAIISTTEKRALARAEDIDGRIKKGEKTGSLSGIPFIAKDNFLVFGAETTAASNILKGF